MPQLKDFPKPNRNAEINWTMRRENNYCHYGTVQGRERWSYVADPRTDGRWRLSVHCGVMGLMAIGEFDDLESAKNQALWVERNNRREYQEIWWEPYGDETCLTGANLNATIDNSYKIEKRDGLWWLWNTSGPGPGIELISKFENCEQAKKLCGGVE